MLYRAAVLLAMGIVSLLGAQCAVLIMKMVHRK